MKDGVDIKTYSFMFYVISSLKTLFKEHNVKDENIHRLRIESSKILIFVNILQCPCSLELKSINQKFDIS